MAIKTKQVTEVVCDICGALADGDYNSVTYCNGNVFAESYCPHDLCKQHMHDWALSCSQQEWERYDGRPSESIRSVMLEDFQKQLEKGD